MDFLINNDQIQEESKIFLHKEECACCSRKVVKYAYVRLTKLPNVPDMMSYMNFDFYHLICKECHEQILQARVFNPKGFPSWSMLKEYFTVPMMMETYRYISNRLDNIDTTDYSFEDFSPWDCSPWEWFNDASGKEFEKIVRECQMEKVINNVIRVRRLVRADLINSSLLYRVAQFC